MDSLLVSKEKNLRYTNVSMLTGLKNLSRNPFSYMSLLLMKFADHEGCVFSI